MNWRSVIVTALSALAFHSLALPAQVSFVQPPTYAQPLNFGVASPAFVADFNGDGKPDILADDDTLYLGNGNGTFTQGPSVKGTVLAVADFNGDGRVDILEEGTGTLLVLLGNGDGTFQAPISSPSGANLFILVAADLNGDGKADVLGIFNNSLMIYISNGDGTFTLKTPVNLGISPTMGAPTGLSVGDFNGDQKPDVAVSVSGYSVAGPILILLGNGDGTFQAPNTVATLYGPNSATVGDFNGDGKLDLAIPTFGLSGVASPGVYVLLGNGDGTFQTPILVISESVYTLAAADLNGDGKSDLVAQDDPAIVQIYLANGDGTFSNKNDYIGCFIGQQRNRGGLAVADFNLDKKPDIAFCNSVLLGNGDGTFQGWPITLVPDIPETINTFPAGAIVGQFNNKGAPGVAVVSNQNTSYKVYILSNDGTGVLSLANTYPLQQPGGAITTADFNGDGNLDLAVLNGNLIGQFVWGYSILLGNGDGTFQSPVFYPLASGGSSIVAADFNNDKKTDLAIGGINANSVAILLGNGDGTFGPPVDYYNDSFYPPLVADFRNDGNLDIASGVIVGNTASTSILFGNGDGTFQTAVFPQNLSSSSFVPEFAADFNNDGKPDLINTAGQVALGNGDGTFTLLPVPNPDYGAGAIADFNGDGILDALTGRGVWLGNGDGTFGSLILVAAPGQGGLPSLSAADMTGNGLADIVFGWSYYLNGIGVIRNTTPTDFTINPAPGSPASQTISAGQTASFKLAIAPQGKFTGPVSLTCSVAPSVAPPATCSLSSSSIQITGPGMQSPTVQVSTSGPVTSGSAINVAAPLSAMPLAWIVVLLGPSVLFVKNRKRIVGLAIPAITLVVMSCGGSGSPSHNSSGTPSGTYSVTITASSGNVSHNTVLKVVVQ